MKNNEPVMLAAVVPLLVSLAARHGIVLPSEVVADVIQGALVLVAAFWARGKVTPTAKAPPVAPPPAG